MKKSHKYHCGDTFTIEIAEVHTHYKDNGDPYPIYRVKGFDAVVMTNIALDKLEKSNSANWVDIAKELPSIDVTCTCSNCNKRERYSKLYKYCPNCGAKMSHQI